MPHEGSFESQNVEYNYSIDKWREAEGEWKEEITEDDLPRVDQIVARVENTEDEKVEYKYIEGPPFDDFDAMEAVLEDMWGQNGYEEGGT